MNKFILPLLLLPNIVAAGTPIVDTVAQTVNQALKAASKAEHVPARLLSAICWVESRHKPQAVALLDGGSPSYGLCQVKENTARWLGFTGPVSALYRPDVNALFAAKYLRYNLRRYSGEWTKVISAYNGGHAMTSNVGYVNKVLNSALR